MRLNFFMLCLMDESEMTYQEMCELISEHWASQGGDVTWEEIWNYSPHGELYLIHIWYLEAKEWKDRQMTSNSSDKT